MFMTTLTSPELAVDPEEEDEAVGCEEEGEGEEEMAMRVSISTAAGITPYNEITKHTDKSALGRIDCGERGLLRNVIEWEMGKAYEKTIIDMFPIIHPPPHPAVDQTYPQIPTHKSASSQAGTGELFRTLI